MRPRESEHAHASPAGPAEAFAPAGGRRGDALADLTVLDRDFMTIPERDILRTKTVMTIIAGEIVYSAPPHR